jgi:haloalkane dehalogenase
MGSGSSRAVKPEATSSPRPAIPVQPRYEKKKISVLGKRMAYYEVVAPDREDLAIDRHTIVFVHGNPTSAYMWRNVMPHCEGPGRRLLAPDLIGMGESQKLDDVGDKDRYSLKEQSKYFSAFLEAVGVGTSAGVADRVTFVVHSWGGTLAAHWGSQHPEAVRGLVSIEVVYVPFPSWERVPKKIRGGVKLMLRRPFRLCFGCCSFDLGAHLILTKNLMLESMPDRVNRGLTKEEMDHYRQGFTDGAESRRPILAFVRSIPVAGAPADVVAIMDAGREWIETKGSDLPALFVRVEPGTMTPEDRDYIRGWKNVTEVAVEGGHLVTEDAPDEVGLAIDKWLREAAVPAAAPT